MCHAIFGCNIQQNAAESESYQNTKFKLLQVIYNTQIFSVSFSL